MFAPFTIGVATGIGATLLIVRGSSRDSKAKSVVKEHEKKDELLLHKYGKPVSSVSIHQYESHTLAYDRSKKIPLWVMEVLSKNPETSADRKLSTFQPDPTVPQLFSSLNTDYWKSGWSRGHMAAAGNYKHCQKSMDDTFYLTNIVPQNMDNNESYWYRIENYCRRLGKTYDEVRLISGPLFLPTSGENGTKYVNYQIIGEGGVSVPTHLFKIIVAEKDGDAPLLGSFVVPNGPIVDEPLTKFQVPLEHIERHTGTVFLHLLQRHKVHDLCEKDGCKLMSLEEYKLIQYSRRIPRAKNMEDLEKLWTEMKKEGVKPDKYLKKAYEKKLTEFQK